MSSRREISDLLTPWQNSFRMQIEFPDAVVEQLLPLIF